jgi:hypothetical protein
MTRASLLVLLLVTGLTLAACGSTEPEGDVQATEIAAGVAATLTAQATPPERTMRE